MSGLSGLRRGNKSI